MATRKLNVQSFPRPPLLEKISRHLQIKWKGTVIADTRDAYWVLETHHPPSASISTAEHRITCHGGEVRTLCQTLTSSSLLPTARFAQGPVDAHAAEDILRVEGFRNILQHCHTGIAFEQRCQPSMVVRQSHTGLRTPQRLPVILRGSVGLFRGWREGRGPARGLLRGLGHVGHRRHRQGTPWQFRSHRLSPQRVATRG